MKISKYVNKYILFILTLQYIVKTHFQKNKWGLLTFHSEAQHPSATL